MVKVEFARDFQKKHTILIKDNTELKQKISVLINLFRNNPEDIRLENHALRKKMKGKHAFSITGDIRIVYEWLGKNTARFLAIGTHEDVY